MLKKSILFSFCQASSVRDQENVVRILDVTMITFSAPETPNCAFMAAASALLAQSVCVWGVAGKEVLSVLWSLPQW
jgi:hypothetical protein